MRRKAASPAGIIAECQYRLGNRRLFPGSLAAIPMDGSSDFWGAMQRARRTSPRLRHISARLLRLIAEANEKADRLEETERRFSILVQGVTDYALYMLDSEGIVTSWNPGAERIKGYSSAEILGRHFSTFYTRSDRDAGVPARALETAAREGRFETEGWRVRKDGTEFWASAVVDAIRNERGELVGFAKITRDLTEKRGIEEQLRQSQKMEAVGQLTGGIAHDFNNLLTIISGNIEIATRALEKGQDIDRAQRAMANAATGATRAAALTQRLLAFSRRQPLSPKALDPNKLVPELADLLRRALGEMIQLDVVAGADLWLVEADPNELESALVNLAINARDAMPAGGLLTIETANAALGTGEPDTDGDVIPGDYVAISVSDTGTGMSREVLAHVFEPFFTTKEVGRGTGLGLSQVYGFVKQSGGHVAIQSEEGRGTTVTLYLPRFMGAPETEQVNGVAQPDWHSRKEETVLVVEDDGEVRAYTTEVLRDLGYQVLEASNAQSALEIVARGDQPLDLLLTDVVMPGMSGEELTRNARLLRPSLKVLYTSGYTRDAISSGGRLNPDVALLHKPFALNDLAIRIRQVLDMR